MWTVDNKRLNTIPGVLLALLLGYVLIMYSIFNLSAITLLKFVALTFISIFLPGIAFLNFLKIDLTQVEKICLAYASGYAIVILEYFISEIFDRKLSFFTLTILAALGSCIAIYWQQNKKINAPNSKKSLRIEYIQIIFLLLFIVLNILAYSAVHLGTDVVPVFRCSRDMQYWCNNTVALQISFPADNLFMLGNALNYHYFSNIPIAFLCEAYKIDVFTMSFPLYGLTKAILMVGAAQFLLSTFQTESRTYVWGNILILCTTGVENVILVTAVERLLLSPFGYDIGFAYGMYFLSFLIRQWQKETFSIRLFSGTILMWMVCVGAKAPIAAVLLLIPALTSLFWLFKKQWKLSLGYGLSILFTFLLICKYCVGMFSVLEGSAAWKLGLNSPEVIMRMWNPEWWDVLVGIMVEKGRHNILLAMVDRCVLVNPPVIFCTIAAVIILSVWIKRKSITNKEIYFCVSLILTALWGLALGIIIDGGTGSEIYFSIASLIPMYCVIFSIYRTYKNGTGNDQILNAKVRRLMVACAGLLMAVGVYRFSWPEWSNSGALRYSKIGIDNIVQSAGEVDYSDRVTRGIRDTDVEALNWIRDHADKNAVVMSDKAILTDNSAYYLYGVFCERQQYLEGIDMLVVAGDEVQAEISRRKELIFNVYSNVDGAMEQAKEEGVDYIVQTLDVAPDFIYDENLLKLVESTSTMRIYRVK